MTSTILLRGPSQGPLNKTSTDQAIPERPRLLLSINFRTARLKPALCLVYFCRLIEHRQYHFLCKHRLFVPFEFRVLSLNISRCAEYRNYPVFTTSGCDQPQQQSSAQTFYKCTCHLPGWVLFYPNQQPQSPFSHWQAWRHLMLDYTRLVRYMWHRNHALK